MKKASKKFITLVELIKNINVLNLTLILTMILSYFNVNRYITFILVMLIALIITNVAQKIIVRYFGDNKSIFQSKFFVIFTIFFNVAFLVYYYLSKEYGMIILLTLFYICCLVGRKIINKKSKSKLVENNNG